MTSIALPFVEIQIATKQHFKVLGSEAFRRKREKNSDPQIKRLFTSSGFECLLPHWEQKLVQVMPDDHSKLVPPLPIPNRTVKQLCADDSAATSVKVGYRQASYKKKTPSAMAGFFFACRIVARK